MITINLEIRLASSLRGAFSVSKFPKEELLQDTVDLACSVLEKNYPSAVSSPFMINPSKSWKKLPDTLYLIMEHENSPAPIIFTKVRKKVTKPQSKIYTIYLIYPRTVSAPTITLEMKSQS